MAEAATFRFENPGVALDVFDDRVEYTIRRRTLAVPLGEIAAVSVQKRPKRLVLTTTEGKTIELPLGPLSEEARAIIAHQMRGAG